MPDPHARRGHLPSFRCRSEIPRSIAVRLSSRVCTGNGPNAHNNARVIAGLYGGFDSESWLGKKITLYPTTTTFGSQTVDCIRIRPLIPKGKNGGTIRQDVPQPEQTQPEPSAEQEFA